MVHARARACRPLPLLFPEQQCNRERIVRLRPFCAQFALSALGASNSDLHFVQCKAEVQVVAGLRYILYFKGNDESGTCQVGLGLSEHFAGP